MIIKGIITHEQPKARRTSEIQQATINTGKAKRVINILAQTAKVEEELMERAQNSLDRAANQRAERRAKR